MVRTALVSCAMVLLAGVAGRPAHASEEQDGSAVAPAATASWESLTSVLWNSTLHAADALQPAKIDLQALASLAATVPPWFNRNDAPPARGDWRRRNRGPDGPPAFQRRVGRDRRDGLERGHRGGPGRYGRERSFAMQRGPRGPHAYRAARGGFGRPPAGFAMRGRPFDHGWANAGPPNAWRGQRDRFGGPSRGRDWRQFARPMGPPIGRGEAAWSFRGPQRGPGFGEGGSFGAPFERGRRAGAFGGERPMAPPAGFGRSDGPQRGFSAGGGRFAFAPFGGPAFGPDQPGRRPPNFSASWREMPRGPRDEVRGFNEDGPRGARGRQPQFGPAGPRGEARPFGGGGFGRGSDPRW